MSEDTRAFWRASGSRSLSSLKRFSGGSDAVPVRHGTPRSCSSVQECHEPAHGKWSSGPRRRREKGGDDRPTESARYPTRGLREHPTNTTSQGDRHDTEGNCPSQVGAPIPTDLLVSTGSPYAAHVSAILAKPHLAFGDTERAALTARITIPFTDAVYTPDCYQGYLGPKHRKYNGYKELAYLHPKYFRPNRGSLDAAGLSETEPYLILRLASWDSSHDLGESGFSFEDGQDALTFVRQMERLGRVVVTADSAVRPPLDEYTVRLSPERMHDVLAFATAYVGEGATMAAEAGVLGVPWIFVSSTGRGFLTDQQSRYGLGYWGRDRHGAEDGLSHLALPNLRSEWQQRKERMLSEKEDVVSFITREIEKWPLGSVTG